MTYSRVVTMSNRVLTVDHQARDESGAERFAANHTTLIMSLLLALAAALLFYVKTDLPQLGQWWEKVALGAGTVFIVSFVIDPLIAVWRRWEVVAADAGLRRSRGGVPARWLVYPAGFRAVGLVVSADTFLRDEWEKSLPALAQGFGYERVNMQHSRRKVRLLFTNRPSPIDGDCVKALDLDGQRVHVGINENGADYYLDTDGHSGMVVAGIPGSGKTVFLRRLVKTFARDSRNQVIVFDGKGTHDFEDLAAKNVAVYSGTPDTNQVINDRLGDLEALLKERASQLQPNQGRIVLIVDECQGYIPVAGLTSEEKKQREKATKALKDFVARGRSLGFFTVLATQKPDSITLPTALRDTCGLRACGRVRTLEAEKMALGDSPGLAQTLHVGQMIIDDGRTLERVKVAQEPER